MRFVEAKQQLQVHDGVNILTVVATGVLKVLQILNQSRNSNTSIDQRHPETVFIFKLSNHILQLTNSESTFLNT